MFPAADATPSKWLPPWRLKPQATLTAIATHTISGVTLYLEAQEPSAATTSSWLAKWLARYVSSASENVRQGEATFIYILVAFPLGEPDGGVRGDVGVIEIGHGTDPVGPPEGVTVSFADLAVRMTRLLA